MGLFDEINKEAEERERNMVAPVVEYMAEAFQICKIVKSAGSGQSRREIVDTIKVERGQEELAKRRALGKAERLGGNCFVVGKYEKVISPNKEQEDEEDELPQWPM